VVRGGLSDRNRGGPILSDTRSILLTGATGYVGGRLLRRLEREDARVRCLARRPDFLRPRVAPETEVVGGDVLDAASLKDAMQDVDVAYYLVHSMAAGSAYAEEDRRAAENFARAAREAGVRRLVYLGGLGSGSDLSTHLASRQEVGRILREQGPPTIEFRAGVIIGSGSLSFELIRSLVHRLPVMITPKWVHTRTQPVWVGDVIEYLLAARDAEVDGSEVVEIGAPESCSYADLMRVYAERRGIKRWMIQVPVLTPRLSSLWLGLVTPVYARIGRELIEGVKNETVVRSDRARELFTITPTPVRRAVADALAEEEEAMAETRWTDALSSSGPVETWTGVRFGTRRIDSRCVHVRVGTDRAFEPIARIGGRTGWYAHNRLWRARAIIDLLVGGVGMRRGRRHPTEAVPGDAIDFWRVEALRPGRLLRLYAEMKLPGRAWLQFEVQPAPGGDGSLIRQTAIFDPIGLAGLAYWYGIYPLHALVFRDMLRGIAEAAERRS